MPHLWLEFALALYASATVAALTVMSGWSERFMRWMAPCLGVGALFHFVSFLESSIQNGQLVPVDLAQSESALAFLLVLVFLAIFAAYRVSTHGVLVAPPVFLLTLASSMSAPGTGMIAASIPVGWIYLHVALIFTGYAALVFSFISAVLYLVQEHSLKSKSAGGFASRLPALAVLDDISGRALQLGFPFMTLGLAAGVVIALMLKGPMSIFEPKILLSVLMWVLYLFLLFMRWKLGVRGRNAAILALFASALAASSWGAHYLTTTEIENNHHEERRP
jgi:ABC-type uncharacterized transport system permease subunit